MPWDPLGIWPNERRWIGLALAGWLVLLRGPAFLENMQSTAHLIPDFFQDYASARNWHEGLPIYARHDATTPRYLGLLLDPKDASVVVNAHPPTSVLIFLPFARLHFANAFLAWNILSLVALAASLCIVQRQLKIPFSWYSLGPLVALLLLCYILWEHCRLGQLTLVLLVLQTGSWALERSGRPRLAGALLRAAATIKLFPAFLFLYYALRGRWRVVFAGLLAVVGLTVVTALVLGLGAFRDSLFVVLPEIQWFRVGWNNESVWGFWSRLFDPAPERVRTRSLTTPLYYSPSLAKSLSILSCVAVAVVLAWAVRRDAKGEKHDLTYALAITAWLLVSPICWDHYLLLLLAPLAVVWLNLPRPSFARTLFLTVVVLFWLGYPLVWTAFDLNGRTASPIDSLGVLSYEFYALLAFFALILMEPRGGETTSPHGSTTSNGTLALGAVIMAGLWTQVVHSIWLDYGLFHYLGGDFGIYRSIAAAVASEGPRAMYDLSLVEPHARELMAYYGPVAHSLNLGPGPYPAVYILPFLLLTAVAPPLGFLIWTLVGAILACSVSKGMAKRFPDHGWGLAASGVLFFPIGFALFFGQLTMLFLYGFYRAYRSLESGREFWAGLWSGALYLKPQYVVFLLLLFLFKRRWRALGGLLLAGLLVLVGSAAIVGPEGLKDQWATLRSMSGFRDVLPIIGPKVMANWRGLLANALPVDVSEETGQLLTWVFSVVSATTLVVVWRGEWNPRGDRFPLQMLATVVVMMMASYHNHIHSAALLLVPGMAVAARASSPRFLNLLLVLGLYAPLPLFWLTGSAGRVAWLLIALMLAALGVIVASRLSPHWVATAKSQSRAAASA